jgi:hypothetical protein
VVCAAGNSNKDLDATPVFPGCYPSPFIVNVGATDMTDALQGAGTGTASNYGQASVHLMAPGDTIWSTWWKLATAPKPTGYIPEHDAGGAEVPTQGYLMKTFTSFAAPQVSAAAVLYMMKNGCDAPSTKQALITTCQPVAGLATKCVGGGYLDVNNLLALTVCPVIV